VIKKPSSDFFSSDKTLCKLLNGECNYEKALNVPWRLAIEKTSIKLYPIARNIQTVVQACSKIKQNVKPNEIESVTVEVFEEAYQVADIENPQSIDEAKFSLKFVASLSLVDEVNGIRSISAGLRNPLVRELEKKIEIKTREDFSLLYPSKQPVRVIVKTKRGETIEVYEDEPIGDISSRNIEAIINKKAEMLSKDTGDLRLLAIPNAIKNIKLNESIGSVLEKLL
jgi:2-methylcitrate dehydratase